VRHRFHSAAAVCAEAVWRRLGERLQQSMKTLPRQRPYTWRTVQGLAVRGPDMLWYRGQLLELLGGHVKVSLWRPPTPDLDSQCIYIYVSLPPGAVRGLWPGGEHPGGPCVPHPAV